MVSQEPEQEPTEQEPTEPEPPKKRGRPSEAVLEARKSHINTTTTTPVIESKKIKQL